MEGLLERLNEKEEDLAALRKLFLENLKEIESGYIEINQDLNDSEAVQQEASRKFIQHKR